MSEMPGEKESTRTSNTGRSPTATFRELPQLLGGEDAGGGEERQRRARRSRHPQGGGEEQHALRPAEQVSPGGPPQERTKGAEIG